MKLQNELRAVNGGWSLPYSKVKFFSLMDPKGNPISKRERARDDREVRATRPKLWLVQ